ncbi:MAG: histidine--tRNA ligase [Bacteroidales bacterium]|jgi:histidyl-tRNA synthetase|nr:histidine--tRNA ligase [Bacteroidales bacterium]
MSYSVVKGTRDFLPKQMIKRNFIFQTIKDIYQQHGFLPIETPAMENLSTLMGKYGEEGDKLLFKILNSGNFLEKADTAATTDYKKLTTQICEKGLRYDLTVPFARFVVNHRNDICFPFKRYQIQPVWRADRPQKGRYREFYQCDADIIGSNSLMNEAELLEIIQEVFNKFGLDVVIKINNRKILAAIAEMIDKSDNLTDITVAIDKLDKVGMDSVCQELLSKGFTAEDIERLKPVLLLNGSNETKIATLETLFEGIETGKKGLEELNKLLAIVKELKIANIELDLTLARGLNYYTGTIIEVKAADVAIGSVVGGGRYDNLTDIFGLPDVSGVGISFGADRIYDCLEQLELFPPTLSHTTQILFINFGEAESLYCLRLAKKLRAEGISSEVYPDNAKLKKQMAYANDKNIHYVALIGENEMKEGKITIKNMLTAEQSLLTFEQIKALLLSPTAHSLSF